MPIRSAEPGDESAIAELHVVAWQVTYRGMVPDEYLDGLSVPRRTQGWRQVIAGIESPGEELLVALEGGQLQGFVHSCRSRDPDAGPHVGEVTAIYVHPDHWGEGIGRRLLEQSVGRLGEAGFSSATLWVLDLNHRARAFYASAGWLPDGGTKDDERAGFTLHEVRYWSALPPSGVPEAPDTRLPADD